MPRRTWLDSKRVTEATARTYLDDEIIKDMARRMLFEVTANGPAPT